MFKKIDVYEYGTGEKLFTATQTKHLNGYNIVSASVNHATGQLEVIVKRCIKLAYLKDNYKLYADGRVKHNERLLAPDEPVIYNGKALPQDYAILFAFGRTTRNRQYDIVHINGDPNDNRLDNLREGATEAEWALYNKAINGEWVIENDTDEQQIIEDIERE